MDHNTYIQEYSVLSERLSSLETWANGIVTIYFAFTTALIAALALNTSSSYNLRVIVPVVGILVSVWAAAHFYHFLIRQEIVLERMAHIERQLYKEDASKCVVHQRRSKDNIRGGRIAAISAAALLLAFVVGWFLLLFGVV